MKLLIQSSVVYIGSPKVSALAVTQKCREDKPAVEEEDGDDEIPNVKVPQTAWSWHINTCHHKPYAESGIGVASRSIKSLLKHGHPIEGRNSMDDNVMDKF